MTDKLHETLTRRELFQIGNVLAMPVLLGGVNARTRKRLPRRSPVAKWAERRRDR